MTQPPSIEPYDCTPVFTEETVPAGLLQEHQTSDGVWGHIVVLRGRLRLHLLDVDEERVLTPDLSGWVQPEQPHQVEPDGPVSFRVEFVREEPGEHPVATIGRSAGLALQKVGKVAADAYLAIDPDLRKHILLSPIFGVSQLFGGDREVQPREQDGSRPVIFIHGLGGRPGNFIGIRTFFKISGRKRMYAFPLQQRGGDKADLEAIAETLVERIQQVLEVNELGDDEQVDIVAHSMGGLVSRIAVSHEAMEGRVANLVTYGTPHRGTWAARYADTLLTRALRPGSQTIERLQSQVPWDEQVLPALHSFWSPNDMLLVPHDTAVVPGANNIEVPGATHFGFLMSPQVWRKTLALLEL